MATLVESNIPAGLPIFQSEAFHESNLPAEVVQLFLQHEKEVFRQIDEENDKIDNYVREMELINQFLAIIERDGTDEGLFIKGDDQKLVDELSQFDDLQHIFIKEEYDWNRGDFDEMMSRIEKHHERYSWELEKGETVSSQLQNLRRQLNQHLEGPLQRQISHASEKMVLKENKLNEALSLFKNGLLKSNDLISNILRNGMHG